MARFEHFFVLFLALATAQACKSIELDNSTHCDPAAVKDSKFRCCPFEWYLQVPVNKTIVFQPACVNFTMFDGEWMGMGFQCTLHDGNACKLEGAICSDDYKSTKDLCCPATAGGELTCVTDANKKKTCVLNYKEGAKKEEGKKEETKKEETKIEEPKKDGGKKDGGKKDRDKKGKKS